MKINLLSVIILFLMVSTNCFASIEIRREIKFGNVLDKEKGQQIDKISIRMLRGETEHIFISLTNSSPKTIHNITANWKFRDTLYNEAKFSVEGFWLKAWYQFAEPKTKNEPSDITLTYVPELLIKNDTILLPSGFWRESMYHSPSLDNRLLTHIRPQGDRFFVLKITSPRQLSPGVYHLMLELSSTDFPSITIPISIELLLPQLPVKSHWKNIIYYFGTFEKGNSNQVSSDDMLRHFKDIKKHGFSGITIRSCNKTHLEHIVSLAQQAELPGPLVLWCNSKREDYNFLNSAKEVFKKFNYDFFVYGFDEPNQENRFQLQRMFGQKLHAREFKIATAVTWQIAKKLESYEKGTLDWANLYLDKSLHQRIKKDFRLSSSIKTYYWQAYIEAPALNRFYSGFYLYKSQLDGVGVFIYQHLWENSYPYSCDLVEMPNNILRLQRPFQLRKNFLLTYPSQDGPIPTLQWEAFSEGNDDLLYCYLLEQIIEEKMQHFPKEANNLKQQFQKRLEEIVQFYKPNSVKNYQKIEKDLAIRLEEMRDWVLDQLIEAY